VFRGEPAENGRGIVANGHDLTAGRFQFLQVGLQLDQLLLAKGSPIRRSKKDQRDRPFLEQRIERDVAVRLIFQGKRRGLFSDGQSGLLGSRRFRRARCLCQKKPGDRKCDRGSDQFHARENSVPGEPSHYLPRRLPVGRSRHNSASAFWNQAVGLQFSGPVYSEKAMPPILDHWLGEHHRRRDNIIWENPILPALPRFPISDPRPPPGVSPSSRKVRHNERNLRI
jgi:hypothetical protein